MLVPYTKPHLSIPDQIKLLESRGMAVSDHARAELYLRRLGYYRLSGYWYPARDSQIAQDAQGKPTYVALETFRAGTTFDRAVDLYVFDKRLRLLFLDALERIEVNLRVEAALLLTTRNPLAYRDIKELHPTFAAKLDQKTLKTQHQVWLDRFDEVALQSKEEFVSRFRQKYSTPLPMWIAIELWDFGLLSRFVSMMKHNDQAALAALYNLPRAELLPSWVRNLNQVRNVCAHHSRLWNRVMTEDPKRPKVGEIPLLNHIASSSFPTSRVYTSAAILQYFMNQISPGSTWKDRFKAHIATFPAGPGIALHHAGFPKDWEKLPLWN